MRIFQAQMETIKQHPHFVFDPAKYLCRHILHFHLSLCNCVAPFWCTRRRRHAEGVLIFYKARDSKCTQALKMARKVNKACDAMHDSLPKQVTSHFNDARVHSSAPAVHLNSRRRCLVILRRPELSLYTHIQKKKSSYVDTGS